VLVPAFMHVMGHRNWWAPRPLARLHRRLGFTDGSGAGSAPTDTPADLSKVSER
jgi:putative drug exporter of the RND superfamily